MWKMTQHLLPQLAKRVKKVSIYHFSNRVNGFVFFSVAGNVVFEIGFLKGKIYEVDL
jgi:hypothetical protein